MTGRSSTARVLVDSYHRLSRIHQSGTSSHSLLPYSRITFDHQHTFAGIGHRRCILSTTAPRCELSLRRQTALKMTDTGTRSDDFINSASMSTTDAREPQSESVAKTTMTPTPPLAAKLMADEEIDAQTTRLETAIAHNNAATGTRTHFLGIPAEMRRAIYELLLPQRIDITCRYCFPMALVEISSTPRSVRAVHLRTTCWRAVRGSTGRSNPCWKISNTRSYWRWISAITCTRR